MADFAPVTGLIWRPNVREVNAIIQAGARVRRWKLGEPPPKTTVESAPASVDVKIVLIDDDIPGVDEYRPARFLVGAEIELTEEEETAGYEVVFQDPPDDGDFDANHVEDLNLWGYRRTQVALKYFQADPLVDAGTADDGDTDTITLADGASEVDDFYVDHTITITGGAGEGQSKTIVAYDSEMLEATVDSDWTTPPDNTSLYEITSSLDRMLATTVLDDEEHAPPRKIVRYATTMVYYDDGEPFNVGEYTRADYPGFDENAEWPPGDLPEGFLKRRWRGIAINGVLVVPMCKVLPPPPLPEEEAP